MARVGTGVVAIFLAAILVASGTSAASKPARPWFNWLHMTSAKDGYALSGRDYLHYRLLRTTDGGHIWHQITSLGPSSTPDIQGTTILFSRGVGQHGFAVERSDNSGRTWTESLPVRNSPVLGAGTPRFVDRQHLYVDVPEGAAAGSEGEALYASSDGGHRWRLVTQTHVNHQRPRGLPFGCDKSGFGFVTPNRGWAGGYCAGGFPFFLGTHDGGRQWHRQTLPGAPRSCSCETSAPVFFSRRIGVVWISGEHNNGAGRWFARVYWTADGGDHWRGSRPTRGRTSPVDVVSRKVVWLFGRLAADPPSFPRLFRTTDAGRTWQSLHVPMAVSANDELDAVDATLGYAASGARLWRTTDGGHRWTTIHAVIAQK